MTGECALSDHQAARKLMHDSTVQFSIALRGYDRAEVDQHVNQLAKDSGAIWQEAAERALQVSQLEEANRHLTCEVERITRSARALEEAQMQAEAPTYEGLGARIISILALADQEARELRARAQADAANDRALAEESALATRQDADDYAMKTQSANDDQSARTLSEAQQQAESLLANARQRADSLVNDARTRADSLADDVDRQARARQDADRHAMVLREEAEAAYERARANSAAAAIDFETTLAARRDSTALEFAAQVAAAEQQLAAVRLRSEQARTESERAQQEAEAQCARMLEQSTTISEALVAEAQAKADRIRVHSERELVAATQRRDNINAELSVVRRDLAALGGVARTSPSQQSEPAADQLTDRDRAREERDADGRPSETVSTKS